MRPVDEGTDIFLRCVRPQLQRLHLVARKYCAKEDVSDLVQETLLRAWRAFSPADGVTHPRAWLYTIMRSVAIDWSRSAGREARYLAAHVAELTDRDFVTDLRDPLSPLPAMDEQQFREFVDERLAAALDGLDPAFREVVVLSALADLTYREIAEVLDCPVGTVMSRMARARRSLRERLAIYAKSEWSLGETSP